jgi:hypothetical protein
LKGSVAVLTPGRCSDALEFQFQLKVSVVAIMPDVIQQFAPFRNICRNDMSRILLWLRHARFASYFSKASIDMWLLLMHTFLAIPESAFRRIRWLCQGSEL